MRFFETILAGAALVAAALAVEINEFPSEVQAGRSYRITYTPGDDTPTKFILRKGKNEDLDTIATLTESATGGEFMWAVDSSLPNAIDYALEIVQGTETNYIGPIALTGGTDPTSSAKSSSSASKTASSTESTESGYPTKEVSTKETTKEVTSTKTSGTATITAILSTGSAGIYPSGNGTASVSRTPSASNPTQTLPIPDGDSAATMFGASPMALLAGALAAFAYIN